MKKILLISPLPPPIGGIASWTVNILNYFNEYSNPEYKLLHLNSSMKFRSITSVSIFSRILYGILNFIIFFVKFLFNILKNPNICHITSSASLGLCKDLVFVLICKIFGIRTVIHYRFGRIPDLEKQKNWEWKLLRTINRVANHVIVLDARSLSTLMRYGDNISLIGNPISPELMIFKDKYTKEENDNLLFVGHVTRKKGIFELFNALEAIKPNCETYIVGPFEEGVRSELEQIYNSKDKVTFHGALTKDQVYKMMIESKMLILPSYTEGFPNVIIEGMALGCAIIATSVGAIPEMLGENRGLVIPPKDIDSLTKSVEVLLHNDAMRNSLSVNAEKYALENYSMESIVKKLEKIWL
ncbi:glycosyltransferase family 4 protein [Sphingobacterium sp. SRCM116780]|uniref:glycosyltransferase family 4 protein n=1 Tax=Sphingobacterium sp. SRCM116780 TaxID=2907623 RepID=UPI001F1B95E2|nr:glycosyltransferase family 4 protein [Sphingobacterium sp. SRCM116780]UIR55956.1 glycosyltransferase family 4 protein [Sphingobacterium sp. SRCM116780]